MSERRVPPKRRGERRRREHDCCQREAPRQQRTDTNGYSAPSHMGGQFEDSGYSSGRGQFGFQHDVT